MLRVCICPNSFWITSNTSKSRVVVRPKPAENYRLYLERFVEFTEDIQVEKITTETMRKYRLWLNRYKNAK